MRLQMDRSADRRTIRGAHADPHHRPRPLSQAAELLQLSLNGGVGCIRRQQLAKAFRLLPAFDFEDLGSGCGEQFFRRLNPSHPSRRLLFVIFHDIFPGDLKPTLLAKIRYKESLIKGIIP
jgi:hypothetical protein